MDEEKKTCPNCCTLGRRQYLRLYQVNFEEAVELCEYPECTYSLDGDSPAKMHIVDRNYRDIPMDPKEFEKNKQTFVAITKALKNVLGAEATSKENLDLENLQDIHIAELDDLLTNCPANQNFINSNFDPDDWDDFVDLCSEDEDKENDNKDVPASIVSEPKDDCNNVKVSNKQIENVTTFSSVLSSSITCDQKNVPIMSIPIEILPEIPQENASEFSSYEVIQMNSFQQQPNVCEISIDKDSNKITITVPGSADATSSFETAIYSSSCPVLESRGRGNGYDYTRRERGGRRITGISREDIIASDIDATTEAAAADIPEKKFSTLLEASERGDFEVVRRPLRGRGSRGPHRGSTRGKLVKTNDPGAPAVPVIKKRRGRPSYKNIGYDRLYESMIKTVVPESQGDPAYQPVVINESLVEADMPCPDNLTSELATVTELEVAVAQEAVSQLLARSHLDLQDNEIEEGNHFTNKVEAVPVTTEVSNITETAGAESVNNLAGEIMRKDSEVMPQKNENSTAVNLTGVVMKRKYRKKKQIVENDLLENVDLAVAEPEQTDVKKRRQRKIKNVEKGLADVQQPENMQDVAKKNSKTGKQRKPMKKLNSKAKQKVPRMSDIDEDLPLSNWISKSAKPAVEDQGEVDQPGNSMKDEGGPSQQSKRYGLRNRASIAPIFYFPPAALMERKTVGAKSSKLKKQSKFTSAAKEDIEAIENLARSKKEEKNISNKETEKKDDSFSESETADSVNVSEIEKTSGAFSTLACFVDLSKFKKKLN